MADPVSIFIPGKPVPMPRPRFGKGYIYNPKEIKDYKKQVQPIINLAMAGREPFPGPVELWVFFTFNPPKSWPKKKKARTLWHTTTPDIDNLLKLLLDTLSGARGVYHDDAQCSRISVYKHYAHGEFDEGIQVDIYPLEDG